MLMAKHPESDPKLVAPPPPSGAQVVEDDEHIEGEAAEGATEGGEPTEPGDEADAVTDHAEIAPTAEPGGEMVEVSAAERQALLRDRDVIDTIDRALRGCKVPAGEVEDVTQLVLLAISRLPLMPPTRPGRLGYFYRMARNQGLLWHRQNERQVPIARSARVETFVAQAVPADAADARDALVKLARTVEPGHWRAFTWLVRMTYGVKAKTLATEAGVKEDVVYQSTSRMRDTLRKSGKAIGILSILLAAAWVVSLAWPKEQVALPSSPKTTLNETRPAAPTQQKERDPVAVAHDIRARAFKECVQRDWRSCTEDLDAAAWLDPNGDQDAAVQAARTDAGEGQNHRKLGDPWRPQFVAVYGKLAEK